MKQSVELEKEKSTDNCCASCPCGSCSVESAERPDQIPVAEIVMGYQFEPLVHRMVDKYGWGEEEARSCFEDLKRFFILAIVTGKPVIPSPKIDEMWHSFILFTADYQEFCLQYAGRFLHHRPRRRDDPKTGEGHSVGETLFLAKQFFGDLSENWTFKADQNPALAQGKCSCSNWCQCS